jgi:hypothetical protein
MPRTDCRETEAALAAERKAAEGLKSDKAALQLRLDQQHAELVAEKERELSKALQEKSASIESLVRGIAKATEEAGRKVS